MLALSLSRKTQRSAAATVARRAESGDCAERRMLEHHAGGRYLVRRELGRGGMGIVFLAYDATLGRDVAIKVLRAEYAGMHAYRERFRAEARMLARLDHAGIVRVHGYDESDSLAWFVMQHVAGESLADRLGRVAYMDAATVRATMSRLCDALAHAHAQGIVHRDLKAENILLDDGGAPVIIDFGVALERRNRPASGNGRTVGTPQYMSPEQAAGDDDLDARSDIYSLGILAYHLLSGQLPFDGPTFGSIATQHVAQPPRALCAVAPHVPPALSAIVHRCLEKRREDRWSDSAALAHALRTAGAHTGRRRASRTSALARVTPDGRSLRLLVQLTAMLGLFRIALSRLGA